LYYLPLQQSPKEVTWSATLKEIDQETISIVANVSLTMVFKTTLTILQVTDPSFLLISNVDSTVTLRTATDVDKLNEAEVQKFFLAEISSNKTAHCKLFFLASMPIQQLKKATFGFYTWAGRKVWIFDSHATDMRDTGFLIFCDPHKVDRDSYSVELEAELRAFPLKMRSFEERDATKSSLTAVFEEKNWKY
jgi:hypothetical protein